MNVTNTRLSAILIGSLALTGSLAAGSDPAERTGGEIVVHGLSAASPTPTPTAAEASPTPIPTEAPPTTPTPDPIEDPTSSPTPTPAAEEAPLSPQRSPTPVPVTTASPASKQAIVPAISSYRGVSLDMDMAAVRKTLGTPKDKEDTQDFFTFSRDESAQVFYDNEKKVRAIMVTFVDDPDALTPKQVFGEDVSPEPDGGIFKMVRYPAAGYWISYNRSAGKDPVVSVVIQKL